MKESNKEHVDWKVFFLVLGMIGVALGVVWDEVKDANKKIDLVKNDVEYIRGQIENKQTLTRGNFLDRMYEPTN